MDGTKILVADDDPVSLKVIARLLERDGYDPVTTDSGGAVAEMVRADPGIKLLLLDVVMPDVDGIAVCRELKEDPQTAHVPVILISGFRKDDTSIQAGLEAGAEGYLLKPIEDIALRAWVKATLRISSLQRELAAHTPGTAPSHSDALERFAKLSHAVNNPLQALYATVDMLMLSLPENEEASALAADIFEHAERVAKVVAEASLQAKALLNVERTSGPE